MGPKSSIPKCPHGVYSPNKDTSYCSICSAPNLEKVNKDQAKKWEDELHKVGLDPVTKSEIITKRKKKA